MSRVQLCFICVELLFTLSPNWLYLGLSVTAIAQNSLRDSVRLFGQQSWNVICCPSGHCFDDFYINNECSLIFCHVLLSIYISDSQVDYLEILDKVSASLESSTSPCDWSVGFKIPEGGCLHFLFSMHSKMTCLQVLWGRLHLFLCWLCFDKV